MPVSGASERLRLVSAAVFAEEAAAPSSRGKTGSSE
jgi:hypothetical protein